MSIHRYRLSLRMTQIDLGLEKGRDDSTRFIVLARPRTGSNLVIGSLMNHPHALACGEIFDDKICHLHPYPLFPWTMSYRNLFPVRFMRRRFFRPMPACIDAVGFKLFYHQCRSRRNQAVWSFLQQQDELRVVHLKRRNILQAHLSFLKAMQTNHWIQFQDGDHDRATLWLDPERCEQVFVKTRDRERAMDAFFSNQPKLELDYEDLGEQYVEQMRRVCDFLGLDSIIDPQPTYKQASMRLSEAIENYAELERRFRGTEWEPFFEE
jgi:LPS sulfotransferase NodH